MNNKQGENKMSKHLIEIVEAWVNDAKEQGVEDAQATLAVLVSNLPLELVNSVQIDLKGFLELIKGENK